MTRDDWQTVRLGDLGTSYGGLAGKSGADFSGGGARYVTFLNVVRNVVLDEEGTGVVRVLEGERQSVIEPGDIIFNASSETPEEAGLGSAVPFGLRGLHLNSFCFGFRPHPNAQIDAHFFALLSRSEYGRAVIRPMAQGSTRYNVSAKRVLGGLFQVPSLEEQRAIAVALADAGRAVAAFDDLIQKKQSIRIATAQRFLTPSELTPDAHIVRLGDVVRVEKGELITSASAETGDVPVIAGGMEPAYFTSRSNRNGLTITISASGANAGYVKLRRGPIWASDCSTISASEFYDIRFVAAQLESRQEQIFRAQFGGAQPHVRPKDLETVLICWPPLDQQRRIGATLSAIDDEVEALVALRAKAELVRRGMTQELLSGRVRLS